MKTNIIQLIHLQVEDYNISLRGLKPSKDNLMKGEITISGNPINCIRHEHYEIVGDKVITDSWHFPLQYLVKWLTDIGSVEGDHVVLQEIIFESNSLK